MTILSSLSKPPIIYWKPVHKFYQAFCNHPYYLGGRQIAYKKGDTLEYVHQDHLGGTNVTTNSSGGLEDTIKYFPFGNARTDLTDVDTDKLFTGQRLDQTGLYFYNARYYDATIGRFISPDSIVPDPFNPQSLNRYSYCLNNPLKYIDPTGHNGDSVEYYVDPSEYEGDDALWGFGADLFIPGFGIIQATLFIPNQDVNGILAGNEAFWDGVTYYEKPEGVGLCIDTTIAEANWNAANPNPTGEPSFLAWFSDQFERLWDDSVEITKLQYRAAGDLTVDAFNWAYEQRWRIAGVATTAFGALVFAESAVLFWVGGPPGIITGIGGMIGGLSLMESGWSMIINNEPVEPGDIPPNIWNN